MGKRLILVGGGHAHMVTLANLQGFVEKGHSVIVVGPSEYHYYSGMGPGMLSMVYRPEEIRFATRHVVEKQGGTFICDKAVRVDPAKRLLFLESGDSLPYDVISFNAGSFVPNSPVSRPSDDIFSVKPIERLQEAQARLLELLDKQPITVGIVGGGPSSAEVSGNIWRLAKDHGMYRPKIKIFAGKRFMGRFPEKVRTLVKRSLQRRGIEIITDGYVKTVSTGAVELDNGSRIDADVIFLALGVKPSRIFAESGLPIGADGGLLVNQFLQSPQYPEIFGGGDCISYAPQALDKVGVYAVRQNPILCHNLMATLEGEPLKSFDPGGDYLLIFNLGDGTGVLRKGWFTLDGRIAFAVKDWIDRRFIKKFQAVE